jgi:hypothetical protein
MKVSLVLLGAAREVSGAVTAIGPAPGVYDHTTVKAAYEVSLGALQQQHLCGAACQQAAVVHSICAVRAYVRSMVSSKAQYKLVA